MDRINGFGDLPDNRERRIRSETAAGKPRGEGIAFEELHAEKGESPARCSLVLVHVVDATDVRVRDLASQPDFVLQAFDGALVGGKAGPNGLQRDAIAAECAIFGLVDLAHAAGAEQTENVEPLCHDVAISEHAARRRATVGDQKWGWKA